MFNPDQMLVSLLQATVAAGASDLHLSVGRPPTARRDGLLVPFEGVHVLAPTDTERIVMSLLEDFQRKELDEVQQVDFSFGIEGVGRFRANAFKQRNTYALALRVVPYRVRSLEELGAPAAANDLLNRPYGLILVVGPTGSGKSTTLAAMIDRINATKPLHILTIEDPVEYLHSHKMSMVNQREVGTDVQSFTDGLRSALREDPDVILLGEMRDLDSIAITLTLAETGHLVFATLHTNDASQALDRIVDVFPPERRDQIQIMLAGSLQGVVSQRLLPAEGGGRVAAYEVLIANDAVRNLLREGKSRQLRNTMISGQQERHADDRDGPGPPGGQRHHQLRRRRQRQRLPERDHGSSGNAAFADAGHGDGRRRSSRVDRLRPARRCLRSTTPNGCLEAPVQDPRRHRAVPWRLADRAGAPRRRDRQRRGAEGRPAPVRRARVQAEVRCRGDLRPVGFFEFPQGPYRPCDAEAREMVGWPRVVGIKPMPSRAALRAETRDEARRLEPWLTNDDFRRFKWWRQVEREFQPFHQRTFFAAHPDLSFTNLNGDMPLTTSPHHQEGVLERMQLIRDKLPGVEDVIMSARRPPVQGRST